MSYSSHARSSSGSVRDRGLRVPIYIQEAEALDDVEWRYPAEHDLLVDDTPGILAAAKQFWGERVTTLFAARVVGAFPPADVTIERIEDHLDCDLLDCARHPT